MLSNTSTCLRNGSSRTPAHETRAVQQDTCPRNVRNSTPAPDTRAAGHLPTKRAQQDICLPKRSQPDTCPSSVRTRTSAQQNTCPANMRAAEQETCAAGHLPSKGTEPRSRTPAQPTSYTVWYINILLRAQSLLWASLSFIHTYGSATVGL